MRRRPNREITVFNLSMLDVIFCALGMMIILFIVVVQTTAAVEQERDSAMSTVQTLEDSLAEASRKAREAQSEADRLSESLAEAQQDKAETKAKLDECQRALEDCQRSKDECEAKNDQPCQEKCPCAEHCCGNEAECPCEQYCECKPTPPFIALVVQWKWDRPGSAADDDNPDIDIIVTDPDAEVPAEVRYQPADGGRIRELDRRGICSYVRPEGCNGKLVKDYAADGVSEVFIANQVPDDGWHTVQLMYYSGEGPADVEIRVFHPGGDRYISRRMTDRDELRPRYLLRYRVKDKGLIELDAP